MTTFHRTKPGHSRETITAWREQHESCAACWRHQRRFGTILQIHHMLGGRVARPNYLWNLLVLCFECHERLGHGRANLATCMALKAASDCECFSPPKMQVWLTRFGTERLPVPAALPDWIVSARQNWERA